MSSNGALAIEITQIICGILAVITFLIIRHKQMTGEWQGVQNRAGIIGFMLLYFIMLVVGYLIWC